MAVPEIVPGGRYRCIEEIMSDIHGHYGVVGRIYTMQRLSYQSKFSFNFKELAGSVTPWRFEYVGPTEDKPLKISPTPKPPKKKRKSKNPQLLDYYWIIFNPKMDRISCIEATRSDARLIATDKFIRKVKLEYLDGSN